MIRPASEKDAPRIAEISVFAKRVNYRSIFQNDKVSFGEMQVYSLAKEYLENPAKLDGIYVYDDEFVKGFVSIDGAQIKELYVEPLMENQGIGGKLFDFACAQGARRLWCLEKNAKARRFYEKRGFFDSGERRVENGESEILMEKPKEAR